MQWLVDWFTTLDLMKAVGLAGQVIFGSRFFVQWFASERAKRSVMPISFWYISIIGAVLTLIYAVHIQDPVFIIPQVGGLAIYLRNLVLVRRAEVTV